MKKMYESPVAEKVEFDYEENVVASNTPPTQRTYYCQCCNQPTQKSWICGCCK